MCVIRNMDTTMGQVFADCWVIEHGSSHPGVCFAGVPPTCAAIQAGTIGIVGYITAMPAKHKQVTEFVE